MAESASLEIHRQPDLRYVLWNQRSTFEDVVKWWPIWSVGWHSDKCEKLINLRRATSPRSNSSLGTNPNIFVLTSTNFFSISLKFWFECVQLGENWSYRPMIRSKQPPLNSHRTCVCKRSLTYCSLKSIHYLKKTSCFSYALDKLDTSYHGIHNVRYWAVPCHFMLAVDYVRY